jgi:hypothetical protein
MACAVGAAVPVMDATSPPRVVCTVCAVMRQLWQRSSASCASNAGVSWVRGCAGTQERPRRPKKDLAKPQQQCREGETPLLSTACLMVGVWNGAVGCSGRHCVPPFSSAMCPGRVLMLGAAAVAKPTAGDTMQTTPYTRPALHSHRCPCRCPCGWPWAALLPLCCTTWFQQEATATV